MAGCGAVNAPAGSSPGALVISAEKATIDTTATDQLSARLASGASARVNWTIAEGKTILPRSGHHQPQWRLFTAALAFPRPGPGPDHGDIPAIRRRRPAYLLTVTPDSSRSYPRAASLAPGGTVQVTERSPRSIPALSAGRWEPPRGVRSIPATVTAASAKPGALTPTAPIPPAPQPIPLPVHCPRAAHLFLLWGLQLEIPAPLRRCTFS